MATTRALPGKPAGYLHNQLLNFRDGRRRYALMNNLVAPLSDAYLDEIAGYFAELDVPYPPPQPAPRRLRSSTMDAGLPSRAMRRATFRPACSAMARP
jgi:cytochrome c553